MANVSAWGTNDWTYNDSINNLEGGGWHILRHKFDAALRQIAKQNGATFFSSKLNNITPKAENNFRYQVTLQNNSSKNLPKMISSKWIVDASGRSSCVLKKMGVIHQQFENQMAAIAWLKPKQNDMDKTTRIKSVEKGWWYTAPLPDESRVVSFHGLPNEVAAMVKNNELFTQQFNAANIYQYSINSLDIVEGIKAKYAHVSLADKFAGENWLAVGDAALSFDPLSSQGIFFALYSGIRGAETIAAATEAPNNLNGILDSYKEKVKSVFVQNQQMRKLHYTMEQRYTKLPYWQQYLTR